MAHQDEGRRLPPTGVIAGTAGALRTTVGISPTTPGSYYPVQGNAPHSWNLVRISGDGYQGSTDGGRGQRSPNAWGYA